MSKRSSTRDAVPRAGPNAGPARTNARPPSKPDDTNPAVATVPNQATTVDQSALPDPREATHPATTLMPPIDPERIDASTSPSALPLPDETGKVVVPAATTVMPPLDPERKGDTAATTLPPGDATGKVPIPSDTSVMVPVPAPVPEVPVSRRSTNSFGATPRRPSSQAIPAARPPADAVVPRRPTSAEARRPSSQAIPAARPPGDSGGTGSRKAASREARPPPAEVESLSTEPTLERPVPKREQLARPSIGGETSLLHLEESTDEGRVREVRVHTVPLLEGPVPKREKHVEPAIPWRAWLEEAHAQWSAITPDLQLKIQIGGAALLFLLLCTIGLVVTRSVTHAHHESSVASDEDDDSLLNAGRLALADKRFGDAVTLLEQAHQARPKSASVKYYLKQAQTDVSSLAALQEAKKAVGENRYPDARTALGRIPDGTDVDADRKLALAELDGQESQYLYDHAEAQLKSGHPGAAQASVARLNELRPDLAGKLDGDVKTALANSGQSGSAPTTSSGNRSGPSEDPELKSALAVFDRDPHAGADALAEVAHGSHKPSVTAQATELAARAKECANAYDATAHNTDLSALERADKACAPVYPNGGLVAEIERRRVDAAQADATSAENHEDWGRAARDYRGILSVRPSDRHASESLKSLLAKAHELYMQGYVAAERDPDGAAHNLEQALRILAPGDADYDKAKTKLAQVKGPEH